MRRTQALVRRTQDTSAAPPPDRPDGGRPGRELTQSHRAEATVAPRRVSPPSTSDARTTTDRRCVSAPTRPEARHAGPSRAPAYAAGLDGGLTRRIGWAGDPAIQDRRPHRIRRVRNRG